MAGSNPDKKEKSKKQRKLEDEKFRKRRDLEDDDWLALRLSFPPRPLAPSSPPVRSIRTADMSQTHHQEPKLISSFARPVDSDHIRPMPGQPGVVGNGGEIGPSRRLPRHNPNQKPRNGKSDTVPAPFLWATTRRATVYSLEVLLANQIHSISGDVHCKHCERQFKLEYDLMQKFAEIGTFIATNKNSMCDRAPEIWKNSIFPRCTFCLHEHSLRPIIAEKKRSVNWLFLLLGQMLGSCTLFQLKYFCKHTKNHRTGAKDRVLYLTYLELCKQLDPNGPFYR